MAIKNIEGHRFGKLVVVSRAQNDKSGTVMWKCKCDCGEFRVVAGTGLRAGRNKSCGCASPRFRNEYSTNHGKSGTRTYRIWAGMVGRCRNKNSKKAHLYALKGIRVCDDWLSFEKFLMDMGEAPDGKSIDRINGDMGYCKDNCRWATAYEQANNTSKNRVIDYKGKKQTVSMWAKDIGIKTNTLEYRVLRGWSIDRALST